MSQSRLSRYRAERLLRKDFDGLRAKVLAVVRSQLRSKGVALDPGDLEACYAQAWQGLYTTVLEGEVVENPSAWLVLVTFRRAIDEHRAVSRTGVIGEDEEGWFSREVDARAPDLAAELDDRMRLRQVFEALRTRLSARECEAASLCYLQGLSRAEAAARMGISEARMRKLMDGAGPARPGLAGKVGGLLETIDAGGWCEQQASLMRAYAFGILDPEGQRHALAVAHWRECPACRAHVASLRGLASVLPLPLLPRVAVAGGTGAAVTAGTKVATGGGGWSGFVGSLTAKLAVTAALLVGAGYAVLGGHAHASPGGRRVRASPVPLPLATSVLSQAPFAVSHTQRVRPARAHKPHSRSRLARPHRPRTAHGLLASVAGAPEFSPEHVSSADTPAISKSTRSALASASASASAPAGEFGFE